MSERRTSPWWYLLFGCGGCLGVVVIGAVVIGFAVFQWARQIESTTKDPQARANQVQRILNAETLPPGYYPAFVLHIPVLLDLAILSDVQLGSLIEPKADSDVPIRERGFIYVNAIRAGDSAREIDDFLAGNTDDVSILDDNDIDVDGDEVVARGELDLPGQPLRFVSRRGTLRVKGHRVRGITTLMVLRCPRDERLRMGILFGPAPGGADDSDSSDPVEESPIEVIPVEAPPVEPGRDPLLGTPADPATITEFMSHFRLCDAR